jgi:hypothetical protein
MSEIDTFFGPGASAQLESQHPTRYLDRSDLQAFAVCPHQGQLRKKHPESGETHDELPVTGDLIHKLAEQAIEACDKNLQEAADYFTNELPKTRPDLQPDILRAGKYLAIELRRFGTNQLLLSEEQISRTLLPETEDAGELLITTKPDVVLATSKAETIIVLDWKSGWLERTNSEAKDDFQTCVICWCLFAKYPVETIHFWYINTRKGTRAYARIERSDELNLQARILETARLFDEGCDDAWPSEAKCSICPVIKWCKLAEEICKELDGDPKTYIDNTVVLAEVLKRREGVMKKVCQAGRVLFGSETRYDDTPKKKSSPRYSFKDLKKEKDTEETENGE